MTAKTRHIEVVIGKRADGHCYAFFYTLDRLAELYLAFERLADDPDVSFTWDDVYLMRSAVRDRLRTLSEARL